VDAWSRRLGILVDTTWLENHLTDPGVRIVDLRWQPRFVGEQGFVDDALESYLRGHIPGAAFVGSVTELTDPTDPDVRLVAPPEQFAELAQRLGIAADTLVVAYDDFALPAAAARFWWTLRYYGHEHVRVLDGGFRKWRAEGRPLSREVPSHRPAAFIPRPRPSWRAVKEEVRAALGNPGVVLIDCMSIEQYRGEAPRPWSVRRGHIPGAVNVPWLATGSGDLDAMSNEARLRAILGDQFFCYRAPEELRQLYQAVGVGAGKRVITYCDLGYAGSNGCLTLLLAGFSGDVAVYDGAMAQWSRDLTLPVETGPGPTLSSWSV